MSQTTCQGFSGSLSRDLQPSTLRQTQGQHAQKLSTIGSGLKLAPKKYCSHLSVFPDCPPPLLVKAAFALAASSFEVWLAGLAFPIFQARREHLQCACNSK